MLIEACLLAFGELLVFYILGLYLPFYPGGGKTSAADTILAGFLIYASVHECLAVVFTLLEMPLMYFFYAEGILLALGVTSSVIFNIRAFGRRVKWSVRNHPFKPWLFFVFLAFALLGFLAILNAGDDTFHTSAVMTTELYHDAAGKYDILTGKALTAMTPTSLLVRWPMGGEFLSMLTGLQPAVLLQYTGSTVTAALSTLAVYRIGRQLFEEKPWKSGLFTLLTAVLLATFSGVRTRGGIFFKEAYSGTGILIFVLVPILILLGLMLRREENWQRLYFAAFLGGIAGNGLSPYSWFVVPAAILCILLPASIIGRKWRGIGLTILADLIPAAMFLFVFFVPSLPITS